MIKAIQTEYNGYKFRSRLEAKWAVFFDTANIKYEYEPEGYEDENGKRYLPDFYLPDFDMYVEVKRDTEDGRKEIIEKCEPAIQCGGAIKQILILSDVPGETTDGGEWAFPIILWHGDAPAWCWLRFWEYETHDKLYCAIDYKLGYSWNVVSRKHEPSIKAMSTERLNWKDSYERQIRQISRILGYRDPEEVDLTVEERISNVKEFRMLTFKALKKAREARFEFGEKPNEQNNKN